MPSVKSISLFTGAGGLDIGLSAAGFESVICIEADRDAQATLRANHPRWRVLEPGDVHSHSAREVLRAGRLRRGEAVLLASGPPCQPFSKARLWVNGRTSGMNDARAKTLSAYLNVAEAALPQVLLIENVRGIAKEGRNGAMDFLKRRVDCINRHYGTHYEFNVLHLSASDFGVPQIRERTYLIADRDGRTFRPPAKTHAPTSGASGLERYSTAWDAIGDLDEEEWDGALSPKGRWAELLPSIPEGCNYLWHTNRGGGIPLFGWRTKFWSFLLKLAKNRPSWTIPAQPGPATGPFHWRNRILSMRELMRLQTFPDNYVVSGSAGSVRRQIGNATPPLIAEILGREIRSQWLDGFSPKLRYLVPRQFGFPPPPNPVAKVPKKFFSLKGDYRPHPGIGKGPRASVR